MFDAVRRHPWERTALGPMRTWSPELRCAAAFVLDNRFPAMLVWGPEMVTLHNDAFVPFLSGKDDALGRGFAQVWSETWHEIGPLAEKAMRGESTFLRDLPLTILRDGRMEECFFTFSYSPVRTADGQVAGFVDAAIETSAQVRAERRLRANEERVHFLLSLSDALRPLGDPDAIKLAAARSLGERLQADRVAYAELLPDGRNMSTVDGYLGPGVASIAGTHDAARFGSFFRALLAGETAIVNDARAELPADAYARSWGRVGAEAGIAHPIIRNGALVATMYVHSLRPRRWSEAEIRLLADASERTWEATNRARAEAVSRERASWLKVQRDAFQAALNDAPLTQSIGVLVDTARRRYQGQARCGFYLSDPDGATLHHVVGMDDAFAAHVAGFAIGPDSVACGLAAHRGEAVIVRDILHDPRWRPWLDLARTHDIRSVWSFPVETVAGPVVGTLSLYFSQPRDADAQDLEFAGVLTHAAAIIISRAQENEERARVQAALRRGEQRLQNLVSGIPQLVWRAAHGGRWTWASPQWTEHTGQVARASLDFGWIEQLHPEDRQVARDVWRDAEERGGFDVEYRVWDRLRGAYRWFQTRAAPVRDDTGRIVEWLGTSTDIHELRELQERQKVLLGELQHRTRNLMGVVRAMSDKTLRSSPDLATFRKGFDDRLEALSRVQGMLSRLAEQDRVTFDQLIRAEVAAIHDGAERITLDGPDGVRLRSSTLQTLAMALHELATNAVKYGALHQPQGRLAITWTCEPDGPGHKPWLHIDWRESQVRMPPAPPEGHGKGQGRQLIEKALPYQLGARTSYALLPDGVHCTIAVPVSASVKGAHAHG